MENRQFSMTRKLKFQKTGKRREESKHNLTDLLEEQEASLNCPRRK